MTTTLFKKVDYTLSKLIADIDQGEIGLPDIQRPFVWDTSKVRDLFDSMYRGFPVGYLLFWANGNADAGRAIGTGGKQAVPRLLIVDGQQRLTSLFAVLRGRSVLDKAYQPREVHIAFRPADATFAVTDAAVRRDPEFIPDVSRLWAADTTRNRFVKEFFRRLREAREVGEDEEDVLTERIDQLYDLQNYPFTALELSATVDEEVVAEVFVRVNSKGVTLNQADFILTLMSVYWEDGRKALEQFCREARQPAKGEASPYNHFVEPDPDQLLRVGIALGFRRARLKFAYSILRGKDLETGSFSEARRDEQFEVLRRAQAYALDLQHWHDFFKALVQAGYRGRGMVTSHTTLFYSYALYLIAKRDFGVDAYRLRALIGRWFFMSSITRRYSASPESDFESDLARLRAAHTADDFAGVLSRVVDDALTDDFWAITLPNELNTSAAYSPTLFAYQAALNVLGARALFSKIAVADLLDPSVVAKKSAVERHHLFPKAHLARLGLTDTKLVNQIANYAHVEWADNLAITDDPPATYYPAYAERFGAEDLERMRYWHALPEGWEAMPYEAFLEARRKRMAEVTRDGFSRLATGP